MSLTRTSVYLNKRKKIYFPTDLVGEERTDESVARAMTINAELMRLGFIVSPELLETFARFGVSDVARCGEWLVNACRASKGANYTWEPMYRNFPSEVMEMSRSKLLYNALLHYWSGGAFLPEDSPTVRLWGYEYPTYITVGLGDEKDFESIFTQILASNISVSVEDRAIVRWFIESKGVRAVYPDTIPFKENLVTVAGILAELGQDVSSVLKTATDVLRYATVLSGGDVSLVETKKTRVKFKSFKRPMRRTLLTALERVINEDDIVRYKNKWTVLFHSLHVGDYSKQFPKCYGIATKLRDSVAMDTFNRRVEMGLASKDDITALLDTLKTRPGDFARRLDHVLRSVTGPTETLVAHAFADVANDVSSRVLLQLHNHLRTRNVRDGKERIAYPKGPYTTPLAFPAAAGKIDGATVESVDDNIVGTLVDRWRKLPSLGKVWIDPLMINCVVPMVGRTDSKALRTVARGTRIPIAGDNNTLRLFLYWVGQDIDLSASLYDEDFKLKEQIAYYNLKSGSYESCHSGDITWAPDGASEFIDITMDNALEFGARYVVMTVNVFSGPNFVEHSTCCAGWMTRDKPNSNEIYDPLTVENRVDIAMPSRNGTPVIFDLKTREAIWCDMVVTPSWGTHGNADDHKASIGQMLRAAADAHNTLPNLYELFAFHADARGTGIVATREEADTVFAFDGTVTPYDINLIASEYLS